MPRTDAVQDAGRSRRGFAEFLFGEQNERFREVGGVGVFGFQGVVSVEAGEAGHQPLAQGREEFHGKALEGGEGESGAGQAQVPAFLECRRPWRCAVCPVRIYPPGRDPRRSPGEYRGRAAREKPPPDRISTENPPWRSIPPARNRLRPSSAGFPEGARPLFQRQRRGRRPRAIPKRVRQAILSALVSPWNCVLWEAVRAGRWSFRRYVPRASVAGQPQAIICVWPLSPSK